MANSQDQSSVLQPNIGPASVPIAPKVNPAIPPAPVPVVEEAAPRPNPGIVSSTDARTVLDQGGADLDRMNTQADPYLEYLQKQANDLRMGTDTRNEAEEKVDLANATAEAGRLQTKVQDDYARYKAGLETLGIQSGLASIAPDLQAGRLLQAANDETTKISEIQRKEDYAVAKAKQARLDKDAAALKSTLTEIKEIKKEKAQALKDQLDKRGRDITIANSLSTYAYKGLKELPPEQQEAFILQTAKDNDISPAALIAALAKEEDTQKKFELTTALQQKALNKSGTAASSKPLSTAALNYLKKNNPILDIGFGDTQEDVDLAMNAAKEIQTGVKAAFSNPALVRDGRFTYEYIQNALANLPMGISRVGFLKSVGTDKLAVNKWKNAKNYGITEDEWQELISEE